MAIVKGTIEMTGSIGNLSFYTCMGSDKVIVRTKGGANKSKIKSSPNFSGLRLQQKEWKGCTGFASVLRSTFGGLQRLADYNLTAVLNGMAKNVQKRDTVHETGKRSILFSQYRNTLEGFNFNRNYPFNSVLRVGVTATIDRETLRARVSVPRINPAVDIQNRLNLPYFRLLVALGSVSDVYYDEAVGSYEPLVPVLHGTSEVFTGEWIPSSAIIPEQTIEVCLGEEIRPYFSNEVSLILSMAIEFGKVGFTGAPEALKYAGSGKVVGSL